jgi:AhpD family alkylhydroperoxidase
MKKILIIVACAVWPMATAVAGEPPAFFKNTYPEHALGPALTAYGALGSDAAKLDVKTRELVGLGVAAQIPCNYCVYAHMKKARAAGATEAEIREAVATAAMVRHWSTVLNGMAYDFEEFKAEYDKLVPTN